MDLGKSLKQFFIVDTVTSRDPFSLGRWEQEKGPDPADPNLPENQQLPVAYEREGKNEKLAASLQTNLTRVKQFFSVPTSQGLVIRKLLLPANPPRPAAILYMAGAADPKRVARVVSGPLMRAPYTELGGSDTHEILHQVVQGQSASRTIWSDIINDMLSGSAAVLVDGDPHAVTVRVEGWAKRAIERPRAEVTVRGPQESFTEDIRTNLSLIRRRMRTPDLMVEQGRLGRLSRTDIAVLYLKSVTNKRLVAEVHRRLRGIDVDYIADSGSLAQFLDDHPYSVYPNVMSTERPDTIAAQVAEGYVAILIDNDSHAIVLPTTIMSLMSSPEDIYLRWPMGTFMRLTRIGAYYVAMLLPGLYVALVNYRQEMIPTPLLMAIAASREAIPFSVVSEVLLMEGAFELIHEAALRVPTVIGPTIGIVGTLILGQAAVQAGIISPILVIITAATALSSFAIPNYELQMGVRIWRFLYIGMASFLGLFGVVFLHTVHVAAMAERRSFGAPFLAPITPMGRKGDVVQRNPSFRQDKRPDLVRPQDQTRQAKITRPWSPFSPSPKKGGGSNDRS